MKPKYGQGSVLISVAGISEWPPKSAFNLTTNSSSLDGSPQITMQIDGTVRVTIRSRQGEEFFLNTPTLEMPPNTPFNFGFRWDEDDASIAINGTILAKTDGTCDFSAPTFQISTSTWTPDVTIERDLLLESDKAKSERSLREQAKKPRNGQRLRTLEENFAALAERTEALSDLQQLIATGRIHHFSSVSAHLRLLICHGRANAHPLLQRVAGLVDSPLRVFASPPSPRKDPVGIVTTPSSGYASQISVEPAFRLYEMDLDVWLHQDAISQNGKRSSNNDFIKIYADSEGAHFDPCVKLEYDAWNDIKFSNLPFYQKVLFETSSVVIELSKRILKEREALCSEPR
ncbi:hypothetical protein [Pseudophaeobacter sp.]|uniref:hypothetical protein n=1 Tax=Pseudophaeobacter sp. TaxID=1971739 RepID=UPI00329A0990